MSARRSRLVQLAHQGEALLLRVVPYGDADAVVSLLVRPLGRVSAMARGARRMRRSAHLVLEPVHTLRVQLDEKPQADLLALRECRLERPRPRLTRRLEALDAAGRALRWVRELAPPSVPEPLVWDEVTSLLDRLDEPEALLPPAVRLAASGLRLLRAVGFGLELESCARCGKPCPPSASAYVDAARGGVICTACGRAPYLATAALRARLIEACGGHDEALDTESAEVARGWVELALEVHAGLTKPP